MDSAVSRYVNVAPNPVESSLALSWHRRLASPKLHHVNLQLADSLWTIGMSVITIQIPR